MARQELTYGALWETIFAAINANFTELYNATGGSVTAEQLTETLQGYVTSGALTTALADYVTDDELTTTLGSYLTSAAFAEQIADYATTAAMNNALAGYVTTEAQTAALAGYVTTAALNSALASYATTAAMNAALGNKVDKIAGKDLSTNDYTNADKNKLAGLTAPTKHDISVNSWGTADSDGVYSFTLTTTQHPVAVFRQAGAGYQNAAAVVDVNGETVTIKSEEAFAGYVVLV